RIDESAGKMKQCECEVEHVNRSGVKIRREEPRTRTGTRDGESFIDRPGDRHADLRLRRPRRWDIGIPPRDDPRLARKNEYRRAAGRSIFYDEGTTTSAVPDRARRLPT